MDVEFAMRTELYDSDFCFPNYKLYNSEHDLDLTQKFYGFDCNVGSFCCYADKENIHKIIDVAKKYELEILFLYKSFNKYSLLEFKTKTIDELRKKNDLPTNFPVIFWFNRRPSSKTDVYLKNYLDL